MENAFQENYIEARPREKEEGEVLSEISREVEDVVSAVVRGEWAAEAGSAGKVCRLLFRVGDERAIWIWVEVVEWNEGDLERSIEVEMIMPNGAARRHFVINKTREREDGGLYTRYDFGEDEVGAESLVRGRLLSRARTRATRASVDDVLAVRDAIRECWERYRAGDREAIGFGGIGAGSRATRL